MIDITKPLELEDGTPAYFVKISSFDTLHVEIPNKPHLSRDKIYIFSRRGEPIYTPKLGQLRNKVMPARKFDTTKPVVYGDKDAKIIHTFDNGNIAVVVDGDTKVHTFDSQGHPEREGGLMLTNKVQRTERYVNVYPNAYGYNDGNCVIHSTLTYAQQKGTMLGNGNFRVKQVLEDDKVVSTEIITD